MLAHAIPDTIEGVATEEESKYTHGFFSKFVGGKPVLPKQLYSWR